MNDYKNNLLKSYDANLFINQGVIFLSNSLGLVSDKTILYEINFILTSPLE